MSGLEGARKKGSAHQLKIIWEGSKLGLTPSMRAAWVGGLSARYLARVAQLLDRSRTRLALSARLHPHPLGLCDGRKPDHSGECAIRIVRRPRRSPIPAFGYPSSSDFSPMQVAACGRLPGESPLGMTALPARTASTAGAAVTHFENRPAAVLVASRKSPHVEQPG